MALTCSACGAENRESAKFCLKCAQPLVALASSQQPAQNSTRRRRKKRKSGASRQAAARQDRLWLVFLALALLMLGFSIWRWGVQHGAAQTAPTTPSAPSATQSAPLSVPLRAPESEALERTQQALRELELEAAEQAAQREAERAAEQARQQDAAHQAELAKAAAKRKDAAAAPPPAQALERDSGITETVERLPGPAAPAPAQTPPAGPARLCAGEGVFARSLCLQNECRKPQLAQHPDCIHLRGLQEALRESSGGG